MNAKTFVLLAVIAANAYAIPIVSDLLFVGKCDKKGETDCGLVPVSLRCEIIGCEHTNVCAHVCTSVLDSLIDTLTGQCVCKQGYYRDQNGLCISLETCLDATVGGRKRREALPMPISPLDCLTDNAIRERCPSVLSVSTRCEKKCDDPETEVCVNVCLGLPGLLGNLVTAITGQCVCSEGYYRDKLGACVSLETCLDANVSSD
uniref:EGF-like domain-containing protein n=1 Tax=Plectus sambesii TaxID=2011161 RepID=A0A914XE63_9BILA